MKLDTILDNQEVLLKSLKQSRPIGGFGQDVETVEDLLLQKLGTAEQLEKFCTELQDKAFRRKMVINCIFTKIL